MKSIKPNITIKELNEFEKRAARNLRWAIIMSGTGCILMVTTIILLAKFVKISPYIVSAGTLLLCAIILVILRRLERNEQITKKAKIKE